MVYCLFNEQLTAPWVSKQVVQENQRTIVKLPSRTWAGGKDSPGPRGVRDKGGWEQEE